MMSSKARIPRGLTALVSAIFFCSFLIDRTGFADTPTTANTTVNAGVDRAAAARDAADRTADGYLMATMPRQWSFPRDHGRHDGFKTEWWYFSGNVADSGGRKFGFQLTFFRVGTSPLKIAQAFPLVLGDVYFAHAAVSDLAAGQFHFKDRAQRSWPGLAASSTDTLNVALRDWSATMAPTQQGAQPGAARGDSILLEAADPALGIHLKCDPGVGPVLEGPGGVNPKGRERGQASYYYSMTRLPTSGTITAAGQTFHVTGLSWMDHEFSSNALAPDQIGWDWVGLTLADGTELMVYRLRNQAGDANFVSGTLIDAAGHPKYLSERDIVFQGSAPWKSSSGGAYPQTWSLSVLGSPPLMVHSRMPGQELRTGATTRIDYFEGACDVATASGQPAGEGYLEMTGYAKPMNQP